MSRQVADILDDMGVVLQLQGNNDAAAEKYRQLLSVRESLLGMYHADVGDACWCIAAIERMAGRLDQAKQFYARAEACYVDSLGSAHAKTRAAHTEAQACIRGMVKRAAIASSVTVRSVLGNQSGKH